MVDEEIENPIESPVEDVEVEETIESPADDEEVEEIAVGVTAVAVAAKAAAAGYSKLSLAAILRKIRLIIRK